jgi:hypothetical protein
VAENLRKGQIPNVSKSTNTSAPETDSGLAIEQLAELLALDEKIDTSDAEGIRARWEFGHLMLTARGGKKRLPNGYLKQLSQVTGKSHTELNWRSKFAELHPTETELASALAKYGSWTDITKELSYYVPKPWPPKDETCFWGGTLRQDKGSPVWLKPPQYDPDFDISGLHSSPPPEMPEPSKPWTPIVVGNRRPANAEWKRDLHEAENAVEVAINKLVTVAAEEHEPGTPEADAKTSARLAENVARWQDALANVHLGDPCEVST